jgi:hypothetical protein
LHAVVQSWNLNSNSNAFIAIIRTWLLKDAAAREAVSNSCKVQFSLLGTCDCRDMPPTKTHSHTNREKKVSINQTFLLAIAITHDEEPPTMDINDLFDFNHEECQPVRRRDCRTAVAAKDATNRTMSGE